VSILRRSAVWFLVAACASPEPQLRPAATDTAQHPPALVAESAQTPAPITPPTPDIVLPAGYSLSAPFYWGNMLEDGERAVLRRGEFLIDTVDAGIGVAVVGKDSLVFFQVQTDTTPQRMGTVISYESFPTEYFLWSPNTKRKLSELVPYFDSNFSSPVITSDSTILYWGIAPRDTTNALYAMRYDFRSAHLDSVSLDRTDHMATDYRYHLGRHQVRGKEVLFDSVAVDATTWRVIRQPGPPTAKR